MHSESPKNSFVHKSERNQSEVKGFSKLHATQFKNERKVTYRNRNRLLVIALLVALIEFFGKSYISNGCTVYCNFRLLLVCQSITTLIEMNRRQVFTILFLSNLVILNTVFKYGQ